MADEELIRDKQLEAIKGKAAQVDVVRQAKQIAKEMHREIGKSGPELSQGWLALAPMPTDLCRVSPFYPIAKQLLGKRDYIRKQTISKNPWGEIKYSGPKLSTYEEDIFLTILAIINTSRIKKKRRGLAVESYSYEGPLLPILNFLGYSKPSKKDYERFMNSLGLLIGGVVEVIAGKKGKRKWSISGMLSGGYGDEAKSYVAIQVNPIFYEIFNQRFITFIDVMERRQLRSPIARSLHRFLKSHDDAKWHGHILTIAQILNMNMEQPIKQIKRQIKNATRELIRVGFLTAGGFETNSDIAFFERRKGQRRISPEQLENPEMKKSIRKMLESLSTQKTISQGRPREQSPSVVQARLYREAQRIAEESGGSVEDIWKQLMNDRKGK